MENKSVKNPVASQVISSYREEDSIDFKKWFGKILMNWYYFGIACFIAFSIAYIMNKRVLPISKIRSTVIVEGENSSQSAMMSMFLGSDMLTSGGNYYNSIAILPSFSIIGRALDRLDFTVDYRKKTMFKEVPYYKNSPINVTFASVSPMVSNLEFALEDIDGVKYRLETEGVEDLGIPEFQGEFKYNEVVTTDWYTFEVEKTEFREVEEEGKAYQVIFTYRSKMSLMKEFNTRLEVADLIEDGGSVIEILMNSSNPQRDIDFLNMLLDEFINNNLERKNIQAIKTIDFIQLQLQNIADSLSITENALEDFRTENRIMDISTQASTLIERVNELEQDRALLRVQNNYYKYLKEYLENGLDGELISPTVLGINDPVAGKLVAELAELQRKLIDLPKGSSSYRIIENKLQGTKRVLLETTKNIMVNSQIAMKSIDERMALVQREAAKLPSTERKLLGIERKFKVNDAYYTFLLEKLSEAQVTKASNTSDNIVLDVPMVIESVNKNKKKINYAIALMLGLFFPFLFMLINDVMDVRVHTKQDIEKVTKKPIVGMISRTKKEGRVLTYKYPKSGFSEAFRSLRTRIEFMARENDKISLMITSSLPGEGKSFISINIAGVFGLTGKKTVLLGFDLRKPKATTYLGVRVEKGLSNYLAGKAELKDIIIRPESANFDFIPSGTIPPNPGELMSSSKMKELFSALKEEYDVIIVDTPPTGVVSDGLWISPFVDMNFFVVRHNYTDKNLLKEVLDNADNNKLSEVALIVNDVVKSRERIPYVSRYLLGGKYGYSYNYGYGYNYGYIDGGYVED